MHKRRSVSSVLWLTSLRSRARGRASTAHASEGALRPSPDTQRSGRHLLAAALFALLLPGLACGASAPAGGAARVQDGGLDLSACAATPCTNGQTCNPTTGACQPRPASEACHGVGHYEVGKEGGYLPCCANLREVFQLVAGERGDPHERVCDEPIGHRNYACIEGSCGDGRCEAPEALACGCPQDCPSAVWEVVDAGGAAPDAATSVRAEAGVHAAVPSMASALQDYLGWTRHSAEPQSISTEIFSLCRAPTAAEEAFVASQHGDNLYLLDWLNDAAVRGAATKQSAAFPIGAAIVKQKLIYSPRGEFELFALGLMIKREPGFDGAHADWEFGYWTKSEGLATGAASAATCGGCHAGSKTDFVFLDQSWRR